METTQVEETLSPRLRDPVGSPVEPPAPGFSWGGAGIRWGSSCTSGAPPVTGRGDPHRRRFAFPRAANKETCV